ncbi:hypothetical protein D9M71_449450 [compost metagenome]
MPFVILHAQHQVVAGDAGVVDQDGRLTEMLLDVLQGLSHGLVIGHVQHQAGALEAVGLEEFGDALGTGGTGGGTDDDGALTTQLQGDGLTDAAGGAGDQGHLTLQTHGVILLMFRPAPHGQR